MTILLAFLILMLNLKQTKKKYRFSVAYGYKFHIGELGLYLRQFLSEALGFYLTALTFPLGVSLFFFKPSAQSCPYNYLSLSSPIKTTQLQDFCFILELGRTESVYELVDC